MRLEPVSIRGSVMKLLFALGVALSVVVAPRACAQGIVDPNNTIVRFAISTGGTNLGNIDIELFNEEKPETVRNFLLYVYSGAYSNLVINRLDNFDRHVLQAGAVALAGEPTTNRFETFEPTRNFGPIMNEYQAGPERHNDFGTIAMARFGSITNSASSEWFLNLKDNPDLDTNFGGYTVFGHIVNTTGSDSGTNVLNYFQAVPIDNILNLFIPNFSELPVLQNRGFNILQSDLYVIDAFVIQNGRTVERTAPTLALNEPAGDVVTTNGTMRFSGTAGDDTEVSRIAFENPTYRSEDIGLTIPGGTTWSVDLPLTPGTNRVTIRSIDPFGNESSREERVIFYSVKRPLSLAVEGPGKVKGVTDGQELELGVNYRLVAKPAAGKFFLGWDGSIQSREKTVTFRMVDNAAVTARFGLTFLGLAKGKYDGLVFPASGGTRANLARITLNLSASGSYFGKLNTIGGTFAIRGRFDSNGVDIIDGVLGTRLLVLTLRLVTQDNAEFIVAEYLDNGFKAEGGLFRVQKYSPADPAPTAGTYTFLVDPLATPGIGGDGYGFGSAVIDQRGKVKMTGTLADGAPIKQKAAMLKENRWALFASTQGGRGGLIGFGQFQTNGVINNVIRWVSPNLPGGTNQLTSWKASPYTPPETQRLFDWTDGVVRLSGGTLTAPIEIDVILNEEGSFTPAPNPYDLQLTIPDERGFFTGSFRHPVTQAVMPIAGAVLQSEEIAAGAFDSGAQNGAVLIRAR
jgi:cyclophilin family peptidyl-prolyl cis-trans isomerase